MAYTTGGPNPLRPYYVPPSIGLSGSNATTSDNISPLARSASAARTTVGNSAQDIFSDFDYSGILGDSSPSLSDSARDLLDRAIRRYMSILLAQPFDVARTILQVHVVQDEADGALPPGDTEKRGQGQARHQDEYLDEESQSSDDENSFFAPSPSVSSTPSRSTRPRPRITDRQGYIPQTSSSRHTLKIKNPYSLMDVMGQLWSTSGATSLWKATNASFMYSLLLPTMNTFIRSLLSAILALPDDYFSSAGELDVYSSSSPGSMLFLSCISSALSAIALSPIDTTRTYLMLTPVSHGPRSLVRALRRLPSPNYLIPPHLLPITILSSTLPQFISSSTPLFLKSYLSLDPINNPSIWGFFNLFSTGVELCIRYPLETVLRRAQIATFTSPALRQQHISHTLEFQSPGHSSKLDSVPVETVVPTPQTYRGVVGTIWSIVYEEGTSLDPREAELDKILGPTARQARAGKPPRRRRGQGLRGLYRGWRIGMWGVIGMWGSGLAGALLGPGEDDSALGRF